MQFSFSISFLLFYEGLSFQEPKSKSSYEVNEGSQYNEENIAAQVYNSDKDEGLASIILDIVVIQSKHQIHV